MDTPNALSRYLKKHAITRSAFARLVKAHPSQISRLASGARGPSAQLAAKISIITVGRVPVTSWSKNGRK